jgi:hypothetical protein
MLRSALAVVLLVGCTDGKDDTGTTPPELDRCGADVPVFEVARSGDVLGEDLGIIDLEVDIPPQGGAPYAPFVGRIAGLEQPELGYNFDMVALDADSGEELGSGEYAMRYICANAGDNTGWMVGAELHLRFYGWNTKDLDGRTAEVEFTATNDEALLVTTTLMANLHDGLADVE